MEHTALIQRRTRSALFGVFAGSIWMLWSNAFVGAAVVVWGSAVTVLVISVMAWSIHRARYIRHHGGYLSTAQRLIPLGLKFWTIVGIEFLVAGGSVFLLVATRRSQLIPIAVAVVVGLHFLPLARILGMPQLNVTGVGMVLIAAVALIVPHPHVRNVVVCAGIGLFMWARAFVALRGIAASMAASPTQ